EDDDRIRSSKQLCKKDPGPTSVDGVDLTNNSIDRTWLSQGCLPTSLYSNDAFSPPTARRCPLFARVNSCSKMRTVSCSIASIPMPARRSPEIYARSNPHLIRPIVREMTLSN